MSNGYSFKYLFLNSHHLVVVIKIAENILQIA